MHFNLVWVFSEKFGCALISIGAFFIYAYALTPAEFGTAVVILSAAQFLAILISIFFEDTLVQLKDINDRYIDTAFWGSILASVIAMVFMITGFHLVDYHADDKDTLALVMFASTEILLTNIGVIYVAKLRRDGRFRLLAFRVLCGRIGGSICGIIAALSAFGPWSILVQSVTGTALQTFILVFSVRTFPTTQIYMPYLKYFCVFGSSLALKRLSWDLLVRMSPMIAGLTLGTTAAGHVAFAWRMVELFRNSIITGVTSYLLPHFSRMQDSRDNMAKEFISVTSLLSFTMTPLFLGILVTAPLIVTTIFEPKWNDTIPLIQLFCISALLGGYRATVPITITASGQPQRMLTLNLLTTLAALLIMLFAGSYGIWVFGAAFIVYIFFLLIGSVPIIKDLIGLSADQQLLPIAKYCIPGLSMACILMVLQETLPNDSIGNNLLVQVILGVILYFITSITFYRKDLHAWRIGFFGRQKNKETKAL
ncbi:MAG: oligosaccharide flippase family protein [Alphaproteobacteria bacterium]